MKRETIIKCLIVLVILLGILIGSSAFAQTYNPQSSVDNVVTSALNTTPQNGNALGLGILALVLVGVFLGYLYLKAIKDQAIRDKQNIEVQTADRKEFRDFASTIVNQNTTALNKVERALIEMGQQVSNNDDKLIAAFKETNYSTMALLKDIMTLNEKSQREFAERKHSELMNAIQQRNN